MKIVDHHSRCTIVSLRYEDNSNKRNTIQYDRGDELSSLRRTFQKGKNTSSDTIENLSSSLLIVHSAFSQFIYILLIDEKKIIDFSEQMRKNHQLRRSTSESSISGVFSRVDQIAPEFNPLVGVNVKNTFHCTNDRTFISTICFWYHHLMGTDLDLDTRTRTRTRTMKRRRRREKRDASRSDWSIQSTSLMFVRLYDDCSL